MLKKIGKSFENCFGYENANSFSLTRPFVLGIFPEDNNKRMMNGYMNKLLYLLQIRHLGSDNIDSNYDIKDVPFDILIRDNNDNVANLVLELIKEHDIEYAKKVMRNINIVSYCNGNSETAKIMYEIHDGLLSKNYTEEEIAIIMKEIFVLQIVDNYFKDGEYRAIPYTTTITIHNIHDFENPNYSDIIFEDGVIKEDRIDGNLLYLYKSFGEDSLSQRPEGSEHIFTGDYIYAPVLNMVMSMVLINSLNHSLRNKSRNLDNLSINIDQLLEKVNEYIKQKGKELDLYTKDDLKDLNLYVMKICQKYFEKCIPVKLLSKEEKSILEERDRIFREYQKLNTYKLDYGYLIDNIRKIVDKIYETNSSKEDVIIETMRSNSGNIDLQYTKKEYILKQIGELKKKVAEFIKRISGYVLPSNIPKVYVMEQHESLIHILDYVKEIINTEELRNILNEVNEDISLKL